MSVYYLNSFNESGKLSDLIIEEEAPIGVEESLKRLEKDFNKENLLEYFKSLDDWEEMINEGYVGDVYEVIKEEDDKIFVKFYEASNPTKVDICVYFSV